MGKTCDKEMLKQADEWLYSMHCLLSVKTDEEDKAYTQQRIDLFNWLIYQTERVQELESHNLKYFDMHKELKQQNKRYREALEVIKNNGTHHEINPTIRELARKALEVGVS